MITQARCAAQIYVPKDPSECALQTYVYLLRRET